MVNSKVIMYAAGGLLAYNLFTKGRALQTMNFYPGNITNPRIDGTAPAMTLAIVVQNTSNQKININSIAGNIYANGFLIGNMKSYRLTQVNPNSEAILYIDCKFSLLGLVNDIIAAIKGDGVKQQLELDAMANVNNFQVPVKLKYKIG